MRADATLPAPEEMYRALCERDQAYEGIFVAAIRTTGIFGRPTCSAKKPLKENIEYYPDQREALLAGYRPCKRCRPIEPRGATPERAAEGAMGMFTKWGSSEPTLRSISL